MSFDEIVVPKLFSKSRPNPEKTQKAIGFFKHTGQLDETLTIEKNLRS